MLNNLTKKFPHHRAVWAAAALCTLTAIACIFPGAWSQLRAAQSQQSQQQPASSQTPQLQRAPETPDTPPANVSTETTIVTVYAAIRDKHGKIVATLNKEDFSLSEDGHPQTITYFQRDTDLPLTLGLLVDTSYSQVKVIDDERKASFTFLDHMLRQDTDKAFVIHFDREVELLQDVTSSHPKLQAALQLVDVTPPDGNSSSSGNDGGQGRGSRGAGTQLYDAVYLASNDVLKGQKGRKAIFVLTDGVDRGSKETLESAIEAAQHSDAAIYALYFPGSEGGGFNRGFGPGGGMGRGGYPGGGGGYPGGGGGRRNPQEEHVDGKKILERMTSETGGELFEISKKLPIDQAYASAEEELRNQYSLAYTPNPGNTGAGYHRIQLTVNQKDDSVQARQGYYTDH